MNNSDMITNVKLHKEIMRTLIHCGYKQIKSGEYVKKHDLGDFEFTVFYSHIIAQVGNLKYDFYSEHDSRLTAIGGMSLPKETIYQIVRIRTVILKDVLGIHLAAQSSCDREDVAKVERNIVEYLLRKGGEI